MRLDIALRVLLAILAASGFQSARTQTSNVFGVAGPGPLTDVIASYITRDLDHCVYLLQDKGYVIKNVQNSGFVEGNSCLDIIEAERYSSSSPLFWGKIELCREGNRVNISISSVGLESGFELVGIQKYFLPKHVSSLYYGGGHGYGWGVGGDGMYLNELNELWTLITGEDPNSDKVPIKIVEHDDNGAMKFIDLNLAQASSVIDGYYNQGMVEEALGRRFNDPWQLAIYSDKPSEEYLNIWAGEPTFLFTVGIPEDLQARFENSSFKYRFDLNGSLTAFDWSLFLDITNDCFTVIPTASAQGLILVESLIGEEPIDFVFDTGASITTINEHKRKALVEAGLVLATTEVIQTVDAEGDITSHNVFVVKNLSIESTMGIVYCENVEVVFTSGLNLLGANVWGDWTDFEIQQDASRIVITK